MTSIKTAISLDRSLFEQADALAQAMNTSRSGLIALALKELIERRRRDEISAQVEAVVQELGNDYPMPHGGLRKMQRRLVEGTW